MLTAIEAGVIISIVLISLGFMFHKSYKIALIQMIWIWILIAFNNGGIDYKGNQWLYENADIISNVDFGLSEWISIPVSVFLYKNGLSYLEYTVLINSLFLMVLYFCIYKKIKNISLFMSLFMIYPLVYVIIQKRFTLAMIVFVIALLFLEQRRKRLSALCMLISTGFHLSTIIMFPYLIKDWILKLPRKIIVAMVIIEFVIIYKANDIILLMVADESMKANDYMAANISVLAGAFFVGVETIMTILTCYIAKDVKTDSYELKNKKKFIREINILSLFYLPLLILNSVFFRYYRIIALTSFFVIVDEVRGSYKKNSIRYYSFWGYVLFMMIAIYLLLTYGIFDWYAHLQMLFEYNEVMQMLF